MALRCLLFSSHEELVQPIWQVLTELGIEGEYCKSAVDAVERVTTQLFQIVITDWDDQPEAAFLLKTARDLKAAQRPLTLAIVSDDARLPEALRAGANSILAKPIRPEQVRDTMSTACQLLRTKQQPGGPPTGAALPAAKQKSVPAAQWETPEKGALGAAASMGGVSVPASLPSSVPYSMPSSVTQAPEKLRAGEFLQSPASTLGAQFDTHSEVKAIEEHSLAEADALTELEPVASSVESPPTQEPKPEELLTGWAMLQARLTRATAPKAEDAPARSELLSYGETPSPEALAAPAEESKAPASELRANKTQQEAESEAVLFAYMSGDAKAGAEPEKKTRSKLGLIFMAAVLAVVCVALEASPPTRQGFLTFYRKTVRAGNRWLNPPPAPLPQAVAQHDSFGQSGDEYKLPTPGNIPDATTDPSQIRVLPVVDPTAKPDKNAPANSVQTQGTAVESPTDQDQNQNQAAPSQGPQAQVEQKDPAPTSGADAPPATAQIPAQQNPAAAQPGVQQPVVTAPVRSSAPPPAPTNSTGGNAGIPSSLRSQIASSTTPESSGAKPPEAAMSSIEPVNLPEAAVRQLLAQDVDPEYPAAAKAGGQHGSVVLQVLIGRDGAVQDAKFLQGSLVFARVAIDAVKQWHFKPYSMNGRAVAVQSVITLNFKPPV